MKCLHGNRGKTSLGLQDGNEILASMANVIWWLLYVVCLLWPQVSGKWNHRKVTSPCQNTHIWVMWLGYYSYGFGVFGLWHLMKWRTHHGELSVHYKKNWWRFHCIIARQLLSFITSLSYPRQVELTTRTVKFNSYSASHVNWCTVTLLNRKITAQWEGLGDIGSMRYELALLPHPHLHAHTHAHTWP